MFDPAGESTGTSYTATVMCLMVAFIFIPVLLIASSPISYWAMGAASAGSVMFACFGWWSWRRTSRVSIPTIVSGRSQGK